jgi:hypothetical protein
MVMVHFQSTLAQITQSFLAAQQSVMVCYLQNINAREAPLSPLRHVESSGGIAPAPSQWEPIHCASASNASQIVASKIGPAAANENLEAAPPAVFSVTASAPQTEIDLDDDALVEALLNLISERTGYPIDMLEAGLDLESDLGIDSIKRIEILNNFQKLLPDCRKAQLENSLEELAGARTVEQIVAWIKTTGGSAAEKIDSRKDCSLVST